MDIWFFDRIWSRTDGIVFVIKKARYFSRKIRKVRDVVFVYVTYRKRFTLIN